MLTEMQAMSAKQLSLENEIKEIKDQCTKLRDENKVLHAKLENTSCCSCQSGDQPAPDTVAAGGSRSFAEALTASVKTAMQEEQCRSAVVIMKMAERKSDANDLGALCSEMDLSSRPTEITRLGKNTSRGPRPMKVTFSSPFDARTFLAKVDENKKRGDDQFQNIRCRPCRTPNEQTRYTKMRIQLNKLNEDARVRGAAQRESYSLRNSGEIWKFSKDESGRWKRVTEWTFAPAQSESEPVTQMQPRNPESGNESAESR